MAGKFTLDLARIVEKNKSRIDTVVRKVTLDVFGAVILKTPVDTGRARMNWIASAEKYSTNSTEGVDPSGSKAIGNVTAIVNQSKVGGIVYLVNNLPYAHRLEYGYSQQAPNGMVRLSVAEFEQWLKKAALH